MPVCKNPYCDRRKIEDHNHGISCGDECSYCHDDFPFDYNDDLEDREDY